MSLLSLNAPVPSAVAAAVDDLSPVLPPFDRVRDDYTFVVKRLGTDADPYRLREQVRTALQGTPPVQARLDGLDTFPDPPSGPGPVLYLAVESPGIVSIHETLVEPFGAIPDLGGDDYTPHVTVARGGDVSPDTLDRLRDRDVPPVTWTVDRLLVYDASYDTVAAELSLPL